MTEVELHINILKEGKLLLNPDRIKLLRSIHQTGSLLTASKKIGASYNKAWRILEALNTSSGKPLIEKLRGGKDGGGAIVTDFGKLILNEYNEIEKMVNNFSKKLNMEINL